MLKYAKAVVGALVAGGSTLGTVWADGNLTGQDWLAVFLATLGGLGVVYAVPNKKAA